MLSIESQLENGIGTAVVLLSREDGSLKGIRVEFKLLYEGKLPATTSSQRRVPEKHQIRKVLHQQLKELWSTHPILSKMKEANVSLPGVPLGEYVKFIEATARKYQICGYRFVPVVFRDFSLSCALDISFLRRDDLPLVEKWGGDLDNRLKTLFDALRMPRNGDEIGTAKPAPDEYPFYVLLEDDSQITKISVAANKLLTPPRPEGYAEDVHLLISVSVNVIASTYSHGTNWMYLGS